MAPGLRRLETMAVPRQRMRSIEAILRDRTESLSKWLDEHAPECRREQRHLDEGAAERAYWHYGYLAALTDVIRLLHEPDHLN